MPGDDALSVRDRLAQVEDAIARACRKAGRPRSEVQLMAVSKTHPVALLLEAAAAGQRLFGENRVQEFAAKAASLPADESLAVHLIGHLQSNKAARAAELFAGIDTVDSLRLAERLEARARELGRELPVLLEIKLSPEPSKDGLAPDSAALEALLERLPDWAAHLPVRGLMTVAPISENPQVATECFRALRVLRDAVARRHPRLRLDALSMGMSGDFEAAIAEGSTLVRVGTAIFGRRPKPASEAELEPDSGIDVGTSPEPAA